MVLRSLCNVRKASYKKGQEEEKGGTSQSWGEEGSASLGSDEYEDTLLYRAKGGIVFQVMWVGPEKKIPKKVSGRR